MTQTGGMIAALEVLLDGGHTLLSRMPRTASLGNVPSTPGGGSLYPPDHANEGGDCLAFDSTDDSSPAALLPLAQSVLDQYVRTARQGSDGRG